MKKLLIILIFVIFLIGCSYEDGKLSFDFNKVKKEEQKELTEEEKFNLEIENEMNSFCPELIDCEFWNGYKGDDYFIIPSTCKNFDKYTEEGWEYSGVEKVIGSRGIVERRMETTICYKGYKENENLNYVYCNNIYFKNNKKIIDEDGFIIYKKTFDKYINVIYNLKDNSFVNQTCSVNYW